jgi:hypothetical protein
MCVTYYPRIFIMAYLSLLLFFIFIYFAYPSPLKKRRLLIYYYYFLHILLNAPKPGPRCVSTYHTSPEFVTRTHAALHRLHRLSDHRHPTGEPVTPPIRRPPPSRYAGDGLAAGDASAEFSAAS